MVGRILGILRRRSKLTKFLRRTEQPKSPREQFGGVFDIVQLSRTFPDSKTFVDMVPRKNPRRISKNYVKKYGNHLDIAGFVHDNFNPPWAPPELEKTDGSKEQATPIKVREYIENMWDALTREADHPNKFSSLLALPFRYIVPGGRFREIFYWDSYFTMLGLRESGRYDLIEEMVKNFAYLINTYGFIPNGNRTYFLTRSQPPIFSLMVGLLAEIRGEYILQQYRDVMVKEYQFWMRGSSAYSFKNKKIDRVEHVVHMEDGEILNRYWDTSTTPREESFIEDVEVGRQVKDTALFYRNTKAGAESGWDFSSRWFTKGGARSSIRTIDMVPIDLNVLLYITEETLSRTFQLANEPKLSRAYDERASARRAAIRKYMWDEESGWFCDYILSENVRDTHPTLAGVFALFGGIATAEQAARIIETLEEKFLREGGLVTTLETTGEQWDAPNGWAPLQYISIVGLERYGAFDASEEIAMRWCALNISVYQKTGLLLEKYNVEDVDTFATGGEYELQEGFGWTNGVLLTLMNKYHINKKMPAGVEVPEIETMRQPAPQYQILTHLKESRARIKKEAESTSS